MASSEDSNVENKHTVNGVLPEEAERVEEAELVGAAGIVDAIEESSEEEETPAPVKVLDPLEEAQNKAQEYLDLAQRTRADLENFRRRTAREREDLLRYGSERVLMDILNVLDDVERAQEHAKEDESALSEGVQMLHKQLAAVLQRHHVTEVEAEIGARFNPNMHEALQTLASEEIEKGHIIAVYQKGYKLHDRLLRAAKVAVAG